MGGMPATMWTGMTLDPDSAATSFCAGLANGAIRLRKSQ